MRTNHNVLQGGATSASWKQEHIMKTNVQKTLAQFIRDGASSRMAMAPKPAGETLVLRDSRHVHLQQARGWTVRALAGSVWIVQDGDIRDVVLNAGDSVTLDRDGPAMFSAFGEARVWVSRNGTGRCPAQPQVPRSAPANAAFA
ncbi:DUF2917 domain-containing protein [Herbaspirillum sp. HC18]|nr:DUF2917 domain-containing protein [Herbaspirillum sp. HC18]